MYIFRMTRNPRECVKPQDSQFPILISIVLSWLACAIHATSSMVPNTTINGKEFHGSCISLTRLLSGMCIDALS